MEEFKDGKLERWKVGRMKGWNKFIYNYAHNIEDGRMEGWKDGRTDGRMDGWTDGRKDRRKGKINEEWINERMESAEIEEEWRKGGL